MEPAIQEKVKAIRDQVKAKRQKKPNMVLMLVAYLHNILA
jgi:hypothetical protein